jgi:hypothetical protein
MEIIFRCFFYHNHVNIAYLNKAPTDLEETKNSNKKSSWLRKTNVIITTL